MTDTMTDLKIYKHLEQGSDEWLQARCGILTASVIGQLITPSTLKVAKNETARGLVRQLVGERLTGQVEDSYTSADMERGIWLEPYARDIYSVNYEIVDEVGLMVRTSDDGHRLGYSPDGLVGDDGLIEIKTRHPKKHLHTILEDRVPSENMAQLHAGLIVSGRKWIDYCSYSPGLPFWTKRVHRDPEWDAVIGAAFELFEESAALMIDAYRVAVKDLPPTEHIELTLESDITI